MFFNPREFRITGTYIWYYCICKREVWLLSRGITADQENTNIEIGRFLHEQSYSREKKEVGFESMKFDIVKRKDMQLVIGEVKTAFFQLLRILYRDLLSKGALQFRVYDFKAS